LEIEPLELREAGNLTIEYARYKMDIEPAGTEAMTQVGKYVVVHEHKATAQPRSHSTSSTLTRLDGAPVT
jgi:hypothetical protein